LQFDGQKLRLNLKGKSQMKLKRKVYGIKRETENFSSINLCEMKTVLEEEVIKTVTVLVTG
jgi:hypothetical protein